MKRISTLISAVLLVATVTNATIRYVALTGNDDYTGLKPELAKSDIRVAIDEANAGDTVFITAGVYYESFILKDGIHIIGEAGTILDGTSQSTRIITTLKDCKLPTTIENLVLQNARHEQRGGAALLRGTVTMRNCIVRGCSGLQCGGVLIEGEAAEASALGARLENCLIHNCTATGHEWPDAGGVANFNGTVSHCTIVNNYGDRYGGIHSESTVENTVMWGNRSEDGFVDPANYVSDESSSRHNTNYADEGFEEWFYVMPWLSKDNNSVDGPKFRYPASFAGAPSSGAEQAMMLNADYSLSSGSLLNGKAGAEDDAEHDGYVKEVNIIEDTLYVTEEATLLLHATVEPFTADDKRLKWSSGNDNVATVTEGVVTGVRKGETVITVTSVAGDCYDKAVVVVTEKPVVIVHRDVVAADSLYKAEDYTVPSYIPLLVAKEAARNDSSAENLKLLHDAIVRLQSKYEPYCMVANINGDPRENMAFCWFTNEGVTDGEVQLISKADATGEDFESGEGVVRLPATVTTTVPLHYAISTSGLIKAAKIDKHTSFRYVSHKAIAHDLMPGKEYSWRVGFAGHWSDVAHFRTADSKQGDFSFIYMTDSHIQNKEYIDQARLCAEAVAKYEKNARFCVFPGDFVDTGTKYNSEWEWERWFEEALRPVIMQMPIVPTDGNHDDSPLLNYTYHFNTDSSFNTESKVKPQFAGITYSFQYGDLLLMAYSMQDFWLGDYSYENLTSTYFSDDLGGWFKRQIARYPKARHRVALVHKNLFSGSDHQRDRETPLMRETLLPVFKECEIDMVLQGHDHTYEVIGPIDPDTRTAIRIAIKGQETVKADPVKNITGKKGGTYDVSKGTLYFIGATCGAKRYTPLTRKEMDDAYNTHKLHNYFDLFTGMFGQPGAPCYTRVTVQKKALLMESFTVNDDGSTTLLNSMRIVRKKHHSKAVKK